MKATNMQTKGRKRYTEPYEASQRATNKPKIKAKSLITRIKSIIETLYQGGQHGKFLG
jgi:hypothetical protein